MAKYEVKLSEEDLQMIKDCHSKNPSIMKAMNEAKKVEVKQILISKSKKGVRKGCLFYWFSNLVPWGCFQL